MENTVNEEKRKKFMEYAGKRVNNVMHDIQILEPMARSNSYDFTKQDVEEMFTAMQETLDTAKEEFYRKFEEKSKATKKVFSFGNSSVSNQDENIDVKTIVKNENSNVESVNQKSTEEVEENGFSMV